MATMIRPFDDWMQEIAEAAQRLVQLGALEGAAGNISVFLPEETPGLAAHLSRVFVDRQQLALPSRVRLPHGVLIITGTGRRLREIANRPDAVLCAVVVDEAGSATLHRAPGHLVEPTSEIDSHVDIHAACLGGSPAPHAVIHAQPPKLTWLSHIPAYRNMARLNRQLLRWQPETIVMLPEGIEILPFETPGTPEQGVGTARAMLHHRLVVWARHGVVARSARGPLAAADLIDYAEAAATYEVNDLLAGRPADGLSLAEIRAIAVRFGVSTGLVDELPDDLL